MEISNLYKIISSREEDGMYHYKALLDTGHDVFKGHFPGQPVMPGVCMLMLIEDCVCDALAKRLRLEYIKSCKFTAVVDPGQNKELEAAFTITPGLALQATLSAAGAIALKLKAQMKYEE